ncbi:hypothetical protein MATL_G00193640 [Megalops atlanticus]|uniref:LIM zinc-binding domain-containing protein n=1 Tax=Megalops atlanticus TaxID=7932 RepID=A0A9D3T4V7_MEGAT|nr:hypothetical protein MATL_G00193640 [Megalops atlanticus]
MSRQQEAEDSESPKRSVRDSGYIDCWDSERSDSLSPPRHGRDDSFDSLDSFGSRSRQTPFPDVVIRGSSDGRGSDSESDAPHRKLPDVRRDDMLARRTSCSEPRTMMPFNQYLPNKSNQSAYVPTPLRKKRAEPEEGRKSWSTATSPIGGDRPFSANETPIGEASCATTQKESPFVRTSGPGEEEEEAEEGRGAGPPSVPDVQKDGLARRRAQSGPLPRRDPRQALSQASVTCPHLEKRQCLRMTSEPSSLGFSSSMDLYRGPVTPGVVTTSIVVTSPVATPPGDGPDAPRKSPLMTEAGPVRDLPSPLAESGRDDMWARRALASPTRAASSPTHFLPVPAAHHGRPRKAQSEGDRPRPRRPSWLDDDLSPTFSHRASVSDDPESVSMIDMRCEEEVFLQPHSQVRHELMHNQYNRFREEEDHWQDDLARWKSRRRSISQDLIKKEEERKMMERLMSDDGSQSQRRKSIKTYREIVEEKERRERELHEAYRSAATPEEAAAVLQRYAQRFTISEAVLERLHLPRLLERSVSVDPGAPPFPTREPNPLRYLRQQSLPAPKFTATIEAMVGLPRSPGRAQNPDRSRARSPERSPTRALPKAVPLLTPKPYTQPRTALEGPKPAQVDGMTPVNGDAGEAFGPAEDGGERGGEGEASTMVFLPSPAAAATAAAVPASPTRAPDGLRKEAEPVPVIPEQEDADAPESTGARLDAEPPVPPDAPAEAPGPGDLEETGQEEATPTRPTSLPTELQEEGGVCEEAEPEAEAEARVSPIDGPARPVGGETAAESSPLKEAQDQPVEEQAALSESSVVMEQNCIATAPVLTEVAVTLGHQHTDTSTTETSIPSLEPPQSAGDESSQTHTATIRIEPLASEGVEVESAKPQLPAPVLSMAKRVDHWSWDPNEERRRQERWQQEQDRMLQEKYQREQEKLKQEWERAQKEVEEEERKYHEEERKILEETVAPLTPRASALPSPGRRDASPLMGPRDPMARSLADWERKQDWLERQARGKDEGAEREDKQRDDSGWSDAVRERTAAAREYHEVTESSCSQSSRQTEAIAQAQQNGQRSPQLQFLMAPSLNSKQSQQQQEEVWRKTASLDRNWSSQQTPPGGVRRSGSYGNVDSNPSRSSSCSSDGQSQSMNRSVSGKKLCSSCGHPLGKGAAMIIETLSLYFHIQCFKCGICKGQLGDTSTGTDVRIRSGLLNCHQCYLRSRSAGQPTTL